MWNNIIGMHGRERRNHGGEGACSCEQRKGSSKACALLLFFGLVCVLAVALAAPVSAQTTNLTVEIKSWNITGIDNNHPDTDGTNHTTIHLRICNTGSVNATNVTAAFAWNDTFNAQYIYLHPHETLNKTLGTIAPGVCKDVFWVVHINRSTPKDDINKGRIYRNFTVNVTSNKSNSTTVADTLRLEVLINQGENDLSFYYYSPENITVCTIFNVFCNVTINNKDNTAFFPIDFDPAIIELVNVSFNVSGVLYDTFYFSTGLPRQGPHDPPFTILYRFHAIGPGTTPVLPMIQEYRGSNYKYAAGTGFPNITICSENGSLNLTKTASKTQNLTFGENVTYTLSVTNTGDMTLFNVTIYDSLTGTYPVGTLNISESKTVYGYHIINVTDICRGWLNNSAYARGKDPCNNNITSNTTYVNITTSYNASFTVAKLANPAANVTVGQPVTYTLRVNNTGNVNLTNVTVVDPLLSLSIVIPILVPNGTWNLSVSYNATEADACRGWINNTLAVNATGPCNDTLTTRYASANVSVTYVSALNVTKTAAAGPYSPGDIISYNITVCNIGNMNLTNVTVNDTLLGLTDHDIGMLEPGNCSSVERNYTVSAEDACRGWIKNTVNVSALDTCGITRYNETSENVTTTYNASLNVTKTADTVGPVAPGDTINYTITVCNTGNVTISNVTINDSLFGTISNSSLSKGECWILNRTHNVTQADCIGWINNTAQVNGTDFCGKDVTATLASRNIKVECERCIAGYKLNKSGFGLANWTINVKNSTGEIVAKNTTDDTGYWQICDLTPGNYTVCEELRSGWTILAPTSGCYENVSLEAVNIKDLNFTNCPCNGSISNCVWLDTNQNGIQDPGEAGLGGVTVNLYRYESPETLYGTTVTDGTGYYIFDKLCAGNYSLEFIPPPGYVFSPKNQGNSTQDSNVDPATWRTDVFYLGTGEFDTTIDAGLYPFEQVPAFTPSGLIALVSLLATIATLSVRRKRC
jgi:uncharacterized repeat protein (TIGR01451 family)